MSSKISPRAGEISALQIPVGEADGNAWLSIVERQIRALKFGSVSITVHEGRVVQIETSVKVRFEKAN